MLTSANRPRWAGCRAGLWLQNAVVKIGPAPLAPHSAPAKRASWSGARPASAAGYELAGRTRPEQRGAALDRPGATSRFARPRPRAAPGARSLLGSEPVRGPTPPARTRRPGRGLSRARRQPRLADASRRFAVAGARVDRRARLRRCAFMGFDGPVRPLGPDVHVEAHENQEPSRTRTDTDFMLDKPSPIRARRALPDRGPGFRAADRSSTSRSRRLPAGSARGISEVEALGIPATRGIGAPLRSVRSVGGGARNPAWTQIRAVKLKVPMFGALADEAAYGAAILAKAGL